MGEVSNTLEELRQPYLAHIFVKQVSQLESWSFCCHVPKHCVLCFARYAVPLLCCAVLCTLCCSNYTFKLLTCQLAFGSNLVKQVGWL